MRHRLPAAALAAVAMTAPLGAQSGNVTLLDYHATAPVGWTSRAPSSSSRLAEFVIDRGKADSAEVVVYSFGPQMAANVDANLTRWKSNFSNTDGSPVSQTVTHDSTGAFHLTFAEYEGTYRRGVGGGSTDSVRLGQRLVSAIIETPKGVIFAQFFGPVARVTADRATFIAFVKSIK